MSNLKVGDKVRLSAKFLKNTGQYTGPEGSSVWTIAGFTNEGRWVVTNERISCTSMFSEEELATDPTLRFRRIAAANLSKVGSPDYS